MSLYLNIFLALVSTSLGFFTAYYIVSRRNNKSYEPDYINAQYELHNRNFQKASIKFLEVLDNINDQNPFYISCLVGLSEAYFAQGNLFKAKEYLIKAIKVAENRNYKLQITQLIKLLNKIDETNTYVDIK